MAINVNGAVPRGGLVCTDGVQIGSCHSGRLHQVPWLRQQLTCGSTVRYSAPSFCRCGIQCHGLGTVDANGVYSHSESTCLGLALAALQLLGGALPSMTLSLDTMRRGSSDP